MLVLAGPGSGKTAVITGRILSLIKDRGIPPEQILVITFSKAAASEMRQRFEKTGSFACAPVTFGTFHAIFFKIIREAYDYDTSDIISDHDKNLFLNDALHQEGITVNNGREYREKLSSCISMVRSGQSIDKAALMLALTPDVLGRIIDRYCESLKNAGKIDFDDMMILCLKVFREREDILKRWQERFRFILIDEFQDINPPQYELVKMLAYPENNIFAVGDDDQAVYGFRGASPGLMFRFERDFKGCRRALLDINYRSGEEILNSASGLISVNKERFRKRVRSFKGKGSVVKALHFETFEEEMNHICDTLADRQRNGGNLHGIAILYRMNNQIRPLYNMLISRNIPCLIKEKQTDIFDHWIAEDIMAYLKITDGSPDRSSFIRIINKPVRYISRDCFRSEKVALKDIYAAGSGRPYATECLEKLERDIAFMRRLDVNARVKYIKNGVGYGQFLKDYSRAKNMDEAELLDIFSELSLSCRGLNSTEQWLDRIEELKTKQSGNKSSEKEGVELMTFHRSKGLEFDTVFIIDASEGYTPQNHAVTSTQIEEERRAFYVAVTRARRELYICECSDRLGRETRPSRFIKEMGL